MKRNVLIILFIAIASFCFASPPKKVVVVLFDTSKSMIGYGDGKGVSILTEVKQTALKSITDKLNPEDYFVFMPFSKGIINKDVFEMEIRNEYDVKAAGLLIENIKAEGKSTYLSKSIMQALKKLETLKQINKNEKKLVLQFYVFTDGLGNGRQDKGENAFDDFLNQYKILKSQYSYLFSKFIILDSDNFSDKIIKKLKAADIEVEKAKRSQVKSKNFVPTAIAELPDSLQKSTKKPELENKPQEKKIKKQIKKKAKKIRFVDKTYIVTNYGTIDLQLANELDDYVETEFVVENSNVFVDYKVENPIKLVTGWDVELDLTPTDNNKLSKLRSKIKNSTMIKLRIYPVSKDEEYYYDPEFINVKVIVEKSSGFWGIFD